MRRLAFLLAVIVVPEPAAAEWSGSQVGTPGGGAQGSASAGYVLADGGVTMTGPLVTDKVVSRPGHDLTAQAPDGGVLVVTNGATIVEFRRDGVTQLKANATILEPQGDTTVQTPDGGLVLEGKFIISKASGNGMILEPRGNLSILAPDGGLVFGPNKATFQGAIADQTERCLIPIYIAQAGTTLSGSIATYNGYTYAGAVTFTAVTGRWVAAGTGTAVWLLRDAAGQSCECTATCTTNGTFRATCVNGLGTGCVMAAGANVGLLWGMDRDGGVDVCTTSQPAIVGLCALGKAQ